MRNPLATTYCGVSLRNPVMVAASGLTETVECIQKSREAKASGVVMKTLCWAWPSDSPRRPPSPHFLPVHLPDGSGGRTPIVGLYSCEYPNTVGRDKYVERLSEFRQADKEFAVFASFQCFGGGSLSDWEDTARCLAQAGASGIELNFSMPILHSERFAGQWEVGEMGEIVAAAKAGAPRLGLAAKLAVMTSRIQDVAMTIAYMGARAIVIFNRISALDFDVDSRQPVLHRSYAGYGGPWVLPSNLAQVAHVYLGQREWPVASPRIDICGSGGVYSGADVIKYILAGATATQVCTIALLKGYGAITTIVDELEEYFTSGAGKGATVTSLRGEGLTHLLDPHKADRVTQCIASVDGNRCKRCASCQAACFREAIRLSAAGTVSVDPARCQGCGLCAAVCPNDAVAPHPVAG